MLLIIGDKVYDATPYMASHPGGSALLSSRAGLDATGDFAAVGHSSRAHAQLAPLLVGQLAPPDPSAPPPPLVVILDKSDASVERAALAAALPGVRVEALDLRSQEAALAHPLLPLADAVMVWHTLRIDAALLARMPRARALVRVGVGYDNCDLPACAAVGLPVANVPNYGTEEVADHAMSLLLNLLRRTSWSEARAKEGEEAHGSDGVALLAAGTRRLRGLTLGLLGCGQIGTAMAVRGKAFGLDVVRPWGGGGGVQLPHERAPTLCAPNLTLPPPPPPPPPCRFSTTRTRPRRWTSRWASAALARPSSSPLRATFCPFTAT